MVENPPSLSAEYSFGPFRLAASERELFNGDVRVSMSQRALTVLIALVERAGELVSKRELMDHVWPNTVVDDSNVKVQVAAIRRTLARVSDGEHYLATVVGRGYRFVAPVIRELRPVRNANVIGPANKGSSIPVALVRPIGRSEIVEALVRRLDTSRLLTVVGPGGIGKTLVALAVARCVAAAARDDVWFVDLSVVQNPQFVPEAVATTIGITARSGDMIAAIAEYLRFRKRPQVVVFDNCEHVIDKAAELAERITLAAPQVRILATSREPLLAPGERIFRLEALAVPLESDTMTVAEALDFPAIELFNERASAAHHDFRMLVDDAPIVAKICRCLDGIPLAIELAAAYVGAMSLNDLLSVLEKQMVNLGLGRRNAPDRQKTLAAMFDWSHELLSDAHRVVFRRLGVFAGTFTLGTAIEIARDDRTPKDSVVESIGSLVAKSMLVADFDNEGTQYRFLDTTRRYALKQLAGAGEADTIARRHAEHFIERYHPSAIEWNASPNAMLPQDEFRALDDVRRALDWAFSSQGDTLLGITLVLTAMPAWVRLFALDECRDWVEKALAQMDRQHAPNDLSKMRLYEALAVTTMYTRGMVPQLNFALQETLALADRLENKEYRLRALYVACCAAAYAQPASQSQPLLKQLRALARELKNAAALFSTDRLYVHALHRAGRQRAAHRHLQRLLRQKSEPNQHARFSLVTIDWLKGAQSIQANALWLRGFPEQAQRLLSPATSDVEIARNPFGVARFLVCASIPLAFYLQDYVMVQDALTKLENVLANHGLAKFHQTIRAVKGALLVQRGDPDGLALMSDPLEVLRKDPFSERYPHFLALYVQGLHAFGRSTEALRVLDAGIASSMAVGEMWYLPELLRIKAELLDTGIGAETHEAVQSTYLDAIDLAKEQGAVSLELRIVTSLACSKQPLGRSTETMALLQATYDKFTEGFDTADLRAARTLLARAKETSASPTPVGLESAR